MGALLLAAIRLLADDVLSGAEDTVRERVLAWFWGGFLAALLLLGWLFGAFGLLTFLVVALTITLVALAVRPALRRDYVNQLFRSSVSTMSITSMVFIILLGATAFALVFTRLGGDALVQDFLRAVPGGTFGALTIVFAIVFVLGFFLDTFEILFIVIPITAPILLSMDVDPIWLGVMLGVLLQTSFLTPPFGFSLFYLRGVAPKSITTGMIYRGVLPFIAIQVVGLAAVWMFPELATWLPEVLFRSPVAEGAIEAAPSFEDSLPEVEGEF
jgi:TRAP-type mannitol/chloroaromatic compound transport system permease large subunit